MLATPLRRAFAAALLVLAVTALIIAIAQVSAQEDGGGGDDEERHSCWDHWLCDQHTAVPTQPPPTTPPTGIPFCDRFPLHPYCLSATSTPRPPTAVPPTDPPPPTDTPVPPPTNTPVPPPTNTPKPPATVAPAPTSTPRPTSTPVPTSTPRPTNTPRPGGGGGQRPTATPLPTNTPLPTQTLPPPERCIGPLNAGRLPVEPPVVEGEGIAIIGLPVYLEPGDCLAVVVTTQGNIRPGFTYQVWMSVVNGLAFDAACTQLEKRWNGLTGRPSYRRIVSVHGCADMVHPSSPGEFGVGLRRNGETVASDNATAFIREPKPAVDLPKPGELQWKIESDAFACRVPKLYFRLDNSIDDESRTTGDGVAHLARSDVHVASPIVTVEGFETFHDYCAFGVVASSSSHPVTIRLTGTMSGAIKDNPPREQETGTQYCVNRQTCLWGSDGTSFSSAADDRIYVAGVHNITSDSHTLRIQTSAGAGTVGLTLWPYRPPNR